MKLSWLTVDKDDYGNYIYKEDKTNDMPAQNKKRDFYSWSTGMGIWCPRGKEKQWKYRLLCTFALKLRDQAIEIADDRCKFETFMAHHLTKGMK